MTDVLPVQTTHSGDETSETRETQPLEPVVQQRAPMGAREDNATSETRNLPATVTDGDVGGEVVQAADAPDSTDVEPVEQVEAAGSVSGWHRTAARARRAGRAGREMFTPPDVWSLRQAAPVERLRYARHGDYTPPGGVLRFLKLGYTYTVSIPVAVVAEEVSWWFERPARGLLTLVTLVAVWVTDPGQTAAEAFAWALRLIADLIVL